jgi:GNAT superfamily N-acetyltransferase
VTAPIIALRAAQPTDAGRLGAMITEAVNAHTWKPRLHSAAQDIDHVGTMIDRGWVTVAELGEATGGFMARDNWDVHALFVGPSWQNRGVGSALVRDAMQHSPKLALWTFQRNTGAQQFYLRHGFVEVDRTEGDNEERLPDIRFLWRRPGAPPQGPRP